MTARPDRSREELALRAATGAAHAAAAVGLAVLASSAAPRPDDVAAYVVLLFLSAAPFAHDALARRGSRWILASYLLQVGALLALPPPLPLPGLAFLLLGHASARWRRDLEAALCLASAPVALLAAISTAPHAALVALLAASLATGMAGAVLLHGRWTRRLDRTAHARARGDAELRPRFRAAATSLALVCGIALPILLALEEGRARIEERIARGGAPPGDAASAPLLPAPPGGRAAGARPAPPASLPYDSVDFLAPRRGSLVSDRVVLRVAEEAEGGFEPEDASGGFREALYLRGSVLDRFGPEGLTLDDPTAPPPRRDEDDGARDGWVRIAAPSDGMPLRRYRIESAPLRVADRPWTMLCTPVPLAAIELEPVRIADDGPSVVERSYDRWLSYRCDAAVPPLLGRDARVDASVAAVYRRLPAASSGAEALEAVARRWTRRSESDLQRVVDVVVRLRAFEYALEETRFTGVDGLAEFVARRRGYCTHFAATAALLLRQSGVPARVAVGYLARERDAHGRWIARERDAHAWIEVPFEGHGWLAFDPTPGGSTSEGEAIGGAESGWSPLAYEPAPRRPGEDWRTPLEDLRDWALGGDGVGLASALAALAEAAARSLAREPWALAVALAALGVLAARLATRAAARSRGRRYGGPERPSPAAEARDLHAALAGLLARHGHRRPAAATLAAHGRQVAAARPEIADLLPELIQRAYSERYGEGGQRSQVPSSQGLTSELDARLAAVARATSDPAGIRRRPSGLS